MNFFDTHCHIQDSRYDVDREEVIQRAHEHNVSMICVGTDLEMSRKAIDLAETHDHMWASIGLHPNDNLDEVYHQSDYADLVGHPRVVAVGEIGLDYYRTTDANKKIFQQKRFEEQLSLAKQFLKPIIIHCRDAHNDMIHMLKSRNFSGVVHSFNGTVDEARTYLECGFLLGLNGIITFSKDYNHLVEYIPLESILLETDAPYLSPVPHRGKRNESIHVLDIAQWIADLKKIPLSVLAEVTSSNATRLFSL